MFPQVTKFREALIARVAPERISFDGMPALNVVSKSFARRQPFVAKITREAPLPAVAPHVYSQRLFYFKLLPAIQTCIGKLRAVNSLQVAF